MYSRYDERTTLPSRLINVVSGIPNVLDFVNDLYCIFQTFQTLLHLQCYFTRKESSCTQTTTTSPRSSSPITTYEWYFDTLITPTGVLSHRTPLVFSTWTLRIQPKLLLFRSSVRLPPLSDLCSVVSPSRLLGLLSLRINSLSSMCFLGSTSSVGPLLQKQDLHLHETLGPQSTLLQKVQDRIGLPEPSFETPSDWRGRVLKMFTTRK